MFPVVRQTVQPVDCHASSQHNVDSVRDLLALVFHIFHIENRPRLQGAGDLCSQLECVWREVGIDFSSCPNVK